MSGLEQLVQTDASARLAAQILQVSKSDAAWCAFAVWLLEEQGRELSLSIDVLSASRAIDGSGRSYRDVAILGFAASTEPETGFSFDVLSKGLTWLLRRPTRTAGRLEAFCHDAVPLLGIALAARLSGGQQESDAKVWFEGFLLDALNEAPIDDWRRCVLTSVAYVAGIDAAVQDVPALADARVALHSKGVLPESVIREGDEVEAYNVATRGHPQEAERSAITLHAFKRVLRPLPTLDVQRPSFSQIEALLIRVEAGLSHWRFEASPTSPKARLATWQVDNEYHVQSLLYTILSPYFPDLEAEENLPTFGHTKPRADLAVPSLSLIIEVKFLRPAASFHKIEEEIKADSVNYFNESTRYQNFIVFVWDDSRRTEEYDRFRTGMRKIPGMKGVVIMARPDRMGPSNYVVAKGVSKRNQVSTEDRSSCGGEGIDLREVGEST